MMNDLTGMEGRKLRMPSVSPLRVMGRVTGRQRGWALGINTIPFHFPATAFPVEMATPRPANLSSVCLWEAMTICKSLLRGVHIRMGTGWLAMSTEAGGGGASLGNSVRTTVDLWSQWATVESRGWVIMDYPRLIWGNIYKCHRIYKHAIYWMSVLKSSIIQQSAILLYGRAGQGIPALYNMTTH